MTFTTKNYFSVFILASRPNFLQSYFFLFVKDKSVVDLFYFTSNKILRYEKYDNCLRPDDVWMKLRVRNRFAHWSLTAELTIHESVPKAFEKNVYNARKRGARERKASEEREKERARNYAIRPPIFEYEFFHRNDNWPIHNVTFWQRK